MKLTINRKKWLRGEGGLESCLLRESDGKMCCVGIYLSALGVSDDSLRDSNTAYIAQARGGELPQQALWLFLGEGREDADNLYAVNDRKCEPCREAKIKELFAKHGVEVMFE